MKKVLSLVLVLACVCIMFASCGGKAEDKAVNVNLTIEAKGEKILDNVTVTYESEDGSDPIALDVILYALDEYEIEYKTTKLGSWDKLEQIDQYDTEDDTYIWELFLNGEEDAAGRLAAVTVADGDKMVLLLNAGIEVTGDEEATTEATTKYIETADDGYED